MPPDVGEEQLERIRRAGQRLGRPDGRLGLLLAALGVGKLPSRLRVGTRLAHLEPDRLELARDLLRFLVVQLVLEHEGLELDRFHPAALFRALDQALDLIRFQQLSQLVLRQEAVSVLSLCPVCTISDDSMFVCPVFPGWEPTLNCYKAQRGRQNRYSVPRACAAHARSALTTAPAPDERQ